MHMVGHATDLDGLHLILPRDATQERPEPIAQLRRNEGASFFGAKDAMVIGAHVGHAAIQPSLRDFGNIQLASPTLKRWAIVVTSLRDKTSRFVAAILQ